MARDRQGPRHRIAVGLDESTKQNGDGWRCCVVVRACREEGTTRKKARRKKEKKRGQHPAAPQGDGTEKDVWLRPRDGPRGLGEHGRRHRSDGGGAGGERPVLGAQNGPRMDEDPVGPRHRVAGGPVRYQHGRRDAMGPHNSLGDQAGAAAQGKGTGAGRERPVLGARSGLRMEEDPLGPRHRVTGDPVGDKHGMKGQGDEAGKGVWLRPHNGPTG